MPADYDVIILVASVGGEISADSLAAEINFNRRLGHRCGVCFAEGPTQDRLAVAPSVAPLIDAGVVALIDPSVPATSRLCILRGGGLVGHTSAVPIELRPETTVAVVGPAAGEARAVGARDQLESARDVLEAPVRLAPVDDAIRQRLVQEGFAADLTADDWPTPFDGCLWPLRPLRTLRPPVTVGLNATSRHAPFAASELARIIGRDIGLRFRVVAEEHLLSWPEGWEVVVEGTEEDFVFLRGLDFFIGLPGSQAEHHALRAQATGVVCLMPPACAPALGEAAVYCGQAHIAEVIVQYLQDPGLYRGQVERARACLVRTRDVDAYGARIGGALAARFGEARGRASIAPRRGRPDGLLMVADEADPAASLQRLSAVARHLRSECEVRYLVWNKDTAAADVLGCRERSIVFDGIAPVGEEMAALRRERTGSWILLARDLPCRLDGEEAAWFDVDLVVLAADLACPNSPQRRKNSIRVGPVVSAQFRWLGQDRAADAEQVSPQPLKVLFALDAAGDETDNNVRRAFERIPHTAGLLCPPPHPGPATREFESDFARSAPNPAGSLWLRESQPDLLVAVSSYETFHAGIALRLPTLFVLPEATDSSHRGYRAHYAERLGFAQVVRPFDERAMLEAVGSFLDPAVRLRMRLAAQRIRFADGAREAAGSIRTAMRALRLRRSA